MAEDTSAGQTARHGSWRRAWGAAGLRAPGAALFDRLDACYREPHRRYHTLQHLDECIANLTPVLGAADRPGEIEVALWFHDAIYDVRRHDNEARSAGWARQAMLDAGAAADAADRVQALVLATSHAAVAESLDARWLVDVDLAILGASADRFDEYEVQVREEYAWVADELFRDKRRALLEGLLARQALYGTPHFHGRLEAAARGNLRRSVSRLAR